MPDKHQIAIDYLKGVIDKLNIMSEDLDARIKELKLVITELEKRGRRTNAKQK